MTGPQSGAQSEVGDRGDTLRRWDPERIGPYVILGRLGAGAMGQVYLGRSAAGRLVAVKTIKVDLAEEAGFRTRFAQEVAAARRVSGFFTAAVVEADPEADLPWLATAYVPAPSLARLVKACGPLPVGTVRWLAAGGAEALESIHGAGLVHRDLKPSNVLVAPDGPRVIDFGVARAAERMGVSTSRGTVGTPAYMAPEQVKGEAVDKCSDVYSLGIILYELLAGRTPFDLSHVPPAEAERRLLEDVIPRRAAAVTPSSLDIGPGVFGAHLLTVTVNAAVRSVHVGAALEHSRLRSGINICAVLVGLRIEMSDLPIWKHGQSHPRESERAEDSQKKRSEAFH